MTNEEIIRGAYAAGKRRITCPVCNGGDSRDEDTMSLHLTDLGSIVGRCYRASCGELVYDMLGTVLPDPPSFEPRPLRAPYRLVTANDYWGKQWLDRTYAPDFFPDVAGANKAGMRVLTDDPDTCVWRLRALDGALVGHITRTKDKTIRTYKDLDLATYYWNGSDTHVSASIRALWIFEDPLSAALCPQTAVALLGTSVPRGLVDDIKKWNLPDTVLVCLDPGAEDAGAKVYNKLVAAGVPATFVPMSKDYKDMTLEERRELEETYA